LVVFLLIVFAAAAIGSLAGPAGGGQWYDTLTKPALNPPSWVFGPVWTLLYLLMAISAWLVWRQKPVPGLTAAMVAFGVQLALNAAWSPLFFGLHRPLWALYDLLALWAALLVTVVLFFRIRPLAGWLMIPYLLWATFAAYLNIMIVRLN
jgi:tryptophan-rich sensory protein